ncbi:hypothetical protein B9Z19DRAFT_1123096 [Tuber borchii]|uniref:Uncharacterized protein n=1 Tax=Tuber borchii TaxID=42251 RepID=A0A2T6ZZ20_TUBBO|nr:hypothetical protein B9Z19DRAFT_1123096 [Tuber borchii]
MNPRCYIELAGSAFYSPRVPSIEVADENIEAIVLKHISFNGLEEGPLRFTHAPGEAARKAIWEATSVYGSDRSAIPVEYFGGKPIACLENSERVDGLAVPEDGGKTI